MWSWQSIDYSWAIDRTAYPILNLKHKTLQNVVHLFFITSITGSVSCRVPVKCDKMKAKRNEMNRNLPKRNLPKRNETCLNEKTETKYKWNPTKQNEIKMYRNDIKTKPTETKRSVNYRDKIWNKIEQIEIKIKTLYNHYDFKYICFVSSLYRFAFYMYPLVLEPDLFSLFLFYVIYFLLLKIW